MVVKTGQVMAFVLTVALVCGCAGPASQSRSFSPGVGGPVEDRLDLANYIGERLHLSATQPAYISRLQLNLIFPEGHKLLGEAHPNVALYNKDGRLLWRHEISGSSEDYAVNRMMSTPLFYAKIGVYYCKEGDQGLCMIQNILYEISSSKELPSGPLQLEYQLPGSYF